jgi:uncharacterized Zn-binding protein involved in type VI secretion
MPPAARISDRHKCPAAKHAGGPIISGEGSVLIGFQPAARVGDAASCKGPTDAVAAGEDTVIIRYQPAARLGDPTAHGGVIVSGCQTVIIGRSTQSETLVAAAGDGVPFCEECERIRQAEERRKESEEEDEGEAE